MRTDRDEVRQGPPNASRRIWIDLDNTPHVPLFAPIIAGLRARGHEVFVTARNAFQVCELADLKGLRYERVGRHHGRNRLHKLAGLFFRAAQLLPFALRTRPHLAVSHGARSQVIACNLLRIPSLQMDDYEHSSTPPLMRPNWMLVPEAIPPTAFHCGKARFRSYPGIKEQIYAWALQPDDRVLDELGLHSDAILAVVRPPATEAHYHSRESEELFGATLQWLQSDPRVQAVLLPRNGAQTEWIAGRWPDLLRSRALVIPRHAVDGLNLLWHADLAISAGGTMNREAAALNVPAYSIFRGPLGAVDRWLSRQGLLTLVESVAEVPQKIRLARRTRPSGDAAPSRAVLDNILDQIHAILHAIPA